jgi:hypothetical protein
VQGRRFDETRGNRERGRDGDARGHVADAWRALERRVREGV